MRPQSFDASESEQWSRWVLEHGLPELPGPDLAVEKSVPVSYWIGPTTAAVLHIRRLVDDDEEKEIRTETDVDLFHLVDSTWEPLGSGGGGWSDILPLARLELPSSHVDLHGMNSGTDGVWGCKALWGVVGTDAAVAEVEQAGSRTRRKVEAPVGAFVVSAEYHQPFTVRVFDHQGELLAEVREEAGFDELEARFDELRNWAGTGRDVASVNALWLRGPARGTPVGLRTALKGRSGRLPTAAIPDAGSGHTVLARVDDPFWRVGVSVLPTKLIVGPVVDREDASSLVEQLDRPADEMSKRSHEVTQSISLCLRAHIFRIEIEMHHVGAPSRPDPDRHIWCDEHNRNIERFIC